MQLALRVGIVVRQQNSKVVRWHFKEHRDINSDFFVLTAELAVAIAGFSGVVVALETQPVRSWAPSRRRDLRVLLQLSALALVFSLVPLAAYSIVDTAGFWRWGLGVYGLIHAADVFTFLLRQTEGVRRPVWLGLVFALAQILVAALLTDSAAEAMYMVSVMWHLGGAAMGFVLLLWTRQSTPAP